MEAMRAYDITRIGFIAAVNLAMIALQKGPYRQLPKGSKLESFIASQNRIYSEAIKKKSNQKDDQGTPLSLSPESLRQAEANWHLTHRTDPDAIARIGDPDERDALMACLEAVDQEKKARLLAMRADKARRR
jgi:hypothetical protein